MPSFLNWILYKKTSYKMVKALLAITSYNETFYEDGTKTGVFVVEALHPYNLLIENGFEVDFVSDTGSYGWDEHSLDPDFLNGEDKKVFDDKNSGFIKGMNLAKKPEEVNAADYAIFFASAGHGAAYDYPRSKGLQRLAAEIYANNGVVAAVCHAPAIFDGLKELNGDLLVKGKKITGFTDEGEEILKVDHLMKKHHMKTVKEVADSNGAFYVQPADPWASFTVVDGRVVTGVNPASAHETTQKAIDVSKQQ